jgi:hypothetical protein
LFWDETRFIESSEEQLEYFGHIKRHDSLLKTIVEWKANAQEEDIKRCTANSLTECTKGTRDRQCRRSIVANLRCEDNTLNMRTAGLEKNFNSTCGRIWSLVENERTNFSQINLLTLFTHGH